jgi:hypothetical protein
MSFNAKVGLKETAPNLAGAWGATTTTASDQIQLLRVLVAPDSELTNTSRSYELTLMRNVVPYEDWGVSTGPNNGAIVALKNGWLPLSKNDWQINSIGYISGSGRNYLIAVLSTGNPTETYGIGTIDKISLVVWSTLAPSK